jgi:hypothetical protein
MTNWFADYHHALLLRSLMLAIAFGVLWPGLWLVLGVGYRSQRHFTQHMLDRTRTWHGHTP